MATVITTGNFKGGVGKTTNAVMISYELSMRGSKTLLVDLDPQANATELLFTTMRQIYGVEPDFKETLEVALEAGDLEPAIIQVKENLDLLPSSEDLQGYEDFVRKNYVDDYTQDTYFRNALAEFSDKYDYIILDVPPQLNKYTDSALSASDYVIVILQTQERSLRGAETYVNHLIQIKEDYDLPLELLGVLPVLQQNGNELDLDVLHDAVESFTEANMFNIRIKQMARLKRFDRTGITDKRVDINDRRVHKIYNDLLDEIHERIKMFGGDN